MNSLNECMPSSQILEQCAQKWNLKQITFVRKMENIVYRCNLGQDIVYLRLTTPLRRSRAEIEAELHWIEHLARSGLNVPKLIADKEGNKIVSLSIEQQQFEAVLFSAIKGVHPSEETLSNPHFLKKLGTLIANMHQISQSYHLPHKTIKREEWFEERGLRHAQQAAAHSKQIQLQGQLEQAVNWIKQLDRTQETYGLIHADLGALNLFTNEDSTISIIDFDDSCYHFFTFDLAIVLFSILANMKHELIDLREKNWMSALVEGYQIVRPLSQEEINQIPKFIHFALLRLFFWIEFHEKLHTFHESALENVLKLKQWLEKNLSNF